ncbi:rod shape-determining protein MreD [Rhodobacterales bacterium HKCCE3408]|nr:rod shape-determining protein MreD [Rhodobacterales bacterium HKCCE3408]
MSAALWHIWSYRLLYVVLALAIFAIRLLPLDIGIVGLPAPDILLALTLAWTLRQPALVPMGLIVPVFLLADFLFQRPPGLLTALVLVLTEWLKGRRALMTEVNFLFEWLSVAIAVAAIIILERTILWVLVAQQTSLGLALAQALMTVLIYPVVVVVSRFVLGVRKIGPGDAEAALG